MAASLSDGPRSIRLSFRDFFLYWRLFLDEVELLESETMLGGGDVWRKADELCFGVEVRISSFQLLDLGIGPNPPLAEFALWRPIC